MREIMEHRRDDLAAELERGERLLEEMRARENELRASLLRISGALQVLDELLAAGAAESRADPPRQDVAAD